MNQVMQQDMERERERKGKRKRGEISYLDAKDVRGSGHGFWNEKRKM